MTNKKKKENTRKKTHVTFLTLSHIANSCLKWHKSFRNHGETKKKKKDSKCKVQTQHFFILKFSTFYSFIVTNCKLIMWVGNGFCYESLNKFFC